MVSPLDAKACAAEPKTEVEKLREELHLMKTAGIIEVAVRNPSVAEYMDHWEGRAEAAEAEVRTLREALEPFASVCPAPESDTPDDHLCYVEAGWLRTAAAALRAKEP